MYVDTHIYYLIKKRKRDPTFIRFVRIATRHRKHYETVFVHVFARLQPRDVTTYFYDKP